MQCPAVSLTCGDHSGARADGSGAAAVSHRKLLDGGGARGKSCHGKPGATTER